MKIAHGRLPWIWREYDFRNGLARERIEKRSVLALWGVKLSQGGEFVRIIVRVERCKSELDFCPDFPPTLVAKRRRWLWRRGLRPRIPAVVFAAIRRGVRRSVTKPALPDASLQSRVRRGIGEKFGLRVPDFSRDCSIVLGFGLSDGCLFGLTQRSAATFLRNS